MIVNTAYPFMGKTLPPSPVTIFNGNTFNYPYTSGGNGKPEILANGVNLYTGQFINFTGINSKGLSKLTVPASSAASKMTLTLTLVTESGASTSINLKMSSNIQTLEYEIPKEFQSKNIQLRLSTPSNNRYQVLAKSATLS